MHYAHITSNNEDQYNVIDMYNPRKGGMFWLQFKAKTEAGMAMFRKISDVKASKVVSDKSEIMTFTFYCIQSTNISL